MSDNSHKSAYSVSIYDHIPNPVMVFSGVNGQVLRILPNGDMEFPQGNISEAAEVFKDCIKKTWYSSDFSEEGRAILVARIRELEAEVEELKSERNRHGQNQEGSEAS